MSDGQPVNSRTDEELLADFLDGRRDAFDTLVRRYSDEMFRFLARFTNSGTTAEDLVQEVFLQLYQAADRFDPTRRFKPWLFTIAANKARDLLRSRKRRPEVPLDARLPVEGAEGQTFADLLEGATESPTSGLERDEQEAIVRGVLDQMPEHLKEVLILSYYHQFPYKEIAQVLDIPLGTVKSRLHAAVGHFGRAYRAAVGTQV